MAGLLGPEAIVSRSEGTPDVGELERTHDPPPVVGMDCGGGARITLPQLSVGDGGTATVVETLPTGA